jgi:FAD:protein FMN transferase
MSGASVYAEALMGTVVTFEVLGDTGDPATRIRHQDAIARAAEWFRHVEAICTRFNPDSELMRLSRRVGEPVPVSAVLFEAVRFALRVAEESGGAFDPTVGHRNAARGFDREFRSGQRLASTLVVEDEAVNFLDVHLDPGQGTITLDRPLTLDLGAVAKGLAIDLAARELREFSSFSIDAGGDLYLGGRNPANEPWSVGIRHPRDPARIFETVRVSNAAVCTSGDYERRSEDGLTHHIVDPRGEGFCSTVASATVVASSAMVADALATAAFVLGPIEGLRLLERNGVEGLIVTPALERFATSGFNT